MPEHTTYVEPFCGSCAVLFNKPRSKAEFVNDADKNITETFKILRANPALSKGTCASQILIISRLAKTQSVFI